MQPFCNRGRWRRWHGGVDSERRFRSLCVKGLSVLIRIVLRRYLPLKLCPAHREDGCVSSRHRQVALLSSDSNLRYRPLRYLFLSRPYLPSFPFMCV